MDTRAQGGVTSDASSHKRTKSSVLKSIIAVNHKRKPSSKNENQPFYSQDDSVTENYMHIGHQSILPPDHPHTRQHLREDSGNRNTALPSPRKSVDIRKEAKVGLEENQKMTRSASFKSFVGKEIEKPAQKEREKEEEDNKMKKSKSATSISAILLRPRSSRGAKAEGAAHQKDKENQTPPSSACTAPPPIWAQFATQGLQEPVQTTKIPLNDQSAIFEEVALYTPQKYSPSKQRNFQGHQQPTLSRGADLKPRPKSEHITPYPTTSASFAETVSALRKSGRDKSQMDLSNSQQQTRQATDTNRKQVAKENRWCEIPSGLDNRKVSNDSAGSDLPMSKRGSRVMAAVAVFNGKAKELPKEPPKDMETVQLDSKAIENAFESLLVSQGGTILKLRLMRPIGSQERPSKHERQNEVFRHQH